MAAGIQPSHLIDAYMGRINSNESLIEFQIE